MSFLRKHRRCNECDDRDKEVFVESTVLKNPVCCKKCGESKDKKPPCGYKAHFECVMYGPLQTDARGEQHHLLLSEPLFTEAGRNYDPTECHTDIVGMVWLRPFCNYQDSCTFLSIQDIPNPDYWRLFEILLESGYGNRYYNHYANHRDVYFINPFGYGQARDNTCSWQDRMIVNFQYFLPIAKSEIKFGWKLDLNDLSSVTLSYAEYGLSYSMKAGETWDCFAKNTLYLTTGNNPAFSNIPKAVCVTPIESTDVKICDAVVSQSSVVYNNETNRCACCDNYCDCIPGTIRIICGSVAQDASVQYCIGGRTGVQDPVGPSREACTYFNDSSGDPHLICVVIYCVDGGIWKADWYCDGTYDGTVTLSSTCCPLTASGNSPTLSCMDCTGCVGISVDPGCVSTSVCCPADPATVHVTFTSTCGTLNGNTVTLVNTSASTWTGFLGLTWILKCSNAGWVLTGNYTSITQVTVVTLTSIDANCTPFVNGNFGIQTIAANPQACGGTTVSGVLSP